MLPIPMIICFEESTVAADKLAFTAVNAFERLRRTRYSRSERVV